MKVILLGELRGKGGEGDVVDVAQGYAENYLFPRRLALPATPGNIKQLEERRHNIAKREEKRLAGADETKAALEGKVVTVERTPGALYYDVVIEPFAHVENLEEVLVITSLTEGQQASAEDIAEADAQEVGVLPEGVEGDDDATSEDAQSEDGTTDQQTGQ